MSVPTFLSNLPPSLVAIVLLLASNVFMTFAWYGHLRYKSSPLLLAIVVSWGIAFFEYCLQVPANRIGSQTFTTAQLKITQEIITLAVFAVFSVTFLGEPLRWNYLAASVCMLAAAVFIFAV
ncbi:DMT family protein [Piscinibacter koreensis]|uniref:DMT family protein n=1 Tax=Piscinibacter koreensis TaxID=2742824 RepID=UPI003CC90C14